MAERGRGSSRGRAASARATASQSIEVLDEAEDQLANRERCRHRRPLRRGAANPPAPDLAPGEDGEHTARRPNRLIGSPGDGASAAARPKKKAKKAKGSASSGAVLKCGRCHKTTKDRLHTPTNVHQALPENPTASVILYIHNRASSVLYIGFFFHPLQPALHKRSKIARQRRKACSVIV